MSLAKYLAENYGGGGETTKKRRRKKPAAGRGNMKLVEEDGLDALPQSYTATDDTTGAVDMDTALEHLDAARARGNGSLSDDENNDSMPAAAAAVAPAASRARFKPLAADEDEEEEEDTAAVPRAKAARHMSVSPPRRARHDSPDASPPRRIRHDSPDASPPRRGRHDSPDASPPRRGRHDSPDALPPRRTRHDSPDASPPRRTRHDSPDASPPRRTRHDSPDASPPRRTRHDSPDASPPRRPAADLSPPRASRVAADLSPPRAPRSAVAAAAVAAAAAEADTDAALLKAGGLQNAAVLREDLRRREEIKRKRVAELGADAGADAETIHRDKSGRILDAKAERRRRRAAEVEQAEAIAKHMEWGRGLRQTQDREQRLIDEAREMAKPLARHVDDVELNTWQKSRLLPEDPMAAYITQQREKEREASGRPIRPKYKGPPPPPNRFNIPPGHRWDGRDRSNGFEAKWFKAQLKTKMLQNEAYKWSVEAM